MTQQLTEPVRLILTSHSIDNVFDYCPRKFEFLNIYDRRPPRDSGYAANVGTALHEGLQAWLIARAEGESERSATEKGFMRFMEFFPWGDEEDQYTSARSFENCSVMLYELIRSSEWDQWELVRIKDFGWAVEIPFRIKHTSIGTFRLGATNELCMFATQGKIDFILRNVRTGEIRTWDLKTTIKTADLVRSEYTWSGQQVGYSQVLHAMLGTTPANHSVWYMIARFNATEPPQIQPLEMRKRGDHVDDYWLAKIDRLNRMKRYAESGWFPRTNGGCNTYNHECSCFNICPSRDVDTIMAWFRQVNAVPQEGYTPWVTLEV